MYVLCTTTINNSIKHFPIPEFWQRNLSSCFGYTAYTTEDATGAPNEVHTPKLL